MNHWVAVLALLFAGGVTAGCNTIQGAGKDLERGGEKIKGTAKDVQRKM